MSKGTTDSGVVMESGQITVLPGEVPRKLPPLTCGTESELSRITRDGEYVPQMCRIKEPAE